MTSIDHVSAPVQARTRTWARSCAARWTRWMPIGSCRPSSGVLSHPSPLLSLPCIFAMWHAGCIICIRPSASSHLLRTLISALYEPQGVGRSAMPGWDIAERIRLLVITGALSTHVRSVTRRYAEELRHRKEVAEEEDEEVDDKLGEPSVRR